MVRARAGHEVAQEALAAIHQRRVRGQMAFLEDKRRLAAAPGLLAHQQASSTKAHSEPPGVMLWLPAVGEVLPG